MRNLKKGTLSDEPTVGRYLTTVTLGLYSSVEELCEAVTAHRREVYDHYVWEIIRDTQLSTEKIDLDLYEVAIDGLLPGKASNRARQEMDVYKIATAFGFRECPAEAGILARINLNRGEWNVGMKPLKNKHSLKKNLIEPVVLCLFNTSIGKLCLGRNFAKPIIGHSPKWIFVWPRQKMKPVKTEINFLRELSREITAARREPDDSWRRDIYDAAFWSVEEMLRKRAAEISLTPPKK